MANDLKLLNKLAKAALAGADTATSGPRGRGCFLSFDIQDFGTRSSIAVIVDVSAASQPAVRVAMHKKLVELRDRLNATIAKMDAVRE